MNELQQFTNGSFSLPVRQLADGSIEFDVEQAAIGLGITQVKNGRVYVQWKRVNNYLKDVSAHVRNDSPLVEKGDFITEAQFYKLAIKANNEKAEHFQDWVTEDVLPSIRKNGMYATPQAAEQLLNNPDMMIEILTRYKDSQAENQRLHDENMIMQPKALFADAVATAHTTILVGELAKLIKQNGVEIGPQRLFKWLRSNGYLIKRKGSDWNMPTQKSMSMKLFKVKEGSVQNPDGSVRITKTPKVTGKGQQYFINKFLTDFPDGEAM